MGANMNYELTNALSDGTISGPLILPSPRLEVRNPTQNINRKLPESECTYRNSLYGRALGFFWVEGGDEERGNSQRLSTFLATPYYLRNE